MLAQRGERSGQSTHVWLDGTMDEMGEATTACADEPAIEGVTNFGSLYKTPEGVPIEFAAWLRPWPGAETKGLLSAPQDVSFGGVALPDLLAVDAFTFQVQAPEARDAALRDEIVDATAASNVNFGTKERTR
jgi:hypothetical protein